MRWPAVFAMGLTALALVFLPKFRDVVVDLLFGNMIVKVCPGDNGVLLNGSYQLPNYVRNEFTAVCTSWTKDFKDLVEKREQTSWSEYLAANNIGPTTIAYSELETFLRKTGWTKTKEGGDVEAHKSYFEKNNRKIVLYIFDSASDNNHMLFVTGN